MLSKLGLAPNNPRRIPKEGCIFTLSRIVSWLLKITGALLLCIAVIGFFIMLVRIGPVLVESVRYIDQQKMAGFVFFTLLGSLLFFPIVGFIGIALAIIGFALGYVGTEVIVSKSIIGTDNQVQINQPNKPPTNNAG